MDITGRNIDVTCYKKSPSDANYVAFQTVSLISGGTSATCSVTKSNVLTSDGLYHFKVQVVADTDNAEATTSVTYDGTNPKKPTKLDIDKKSSCEYRVKLKTADDGGQTSYVEIYRDDSTSFTVDSSTLIKTVTIGSNTEYDYTNNLAGGECAKTQYYAVRAFDIAGNASEVRAQQDVIITKVVTTSSSSSSNNQNNTLETQGGAIVVDNTGVAQGGTEGGQVLAETETEDESSDSENTIELDKVDQEGEKGDVLGADDTKNQTRWLLFFGIIGTAIALAGGFYYVQKNKQN
jgi:hypothetical protein